MLHIKLKPTTHATILYKYFDHIHILDPGYGSKVKLYFFFIFFLEVVVAYQIEGN